jgi:RNA recognition motif-containing protein
MIKKLQARNEPRKSRGCSFVTLASEEMQKKAVAEMNGIEIGGRENAVNIAVDKPDEDRPIQGKCNSRKDCCPHHYDAKWEATCFPTASKKSQAHSLKFSDLKSAHGSTTNFIGNSYIIHMLQCGPCYGSIPF